MTQYLQQNQVNSYGYVPPNLLVNPGMEVWQRGIGPFLAAPTPLFSADEWHLTSSGADTLTGSQETTIVRSVTSLKLIQVGVSAGVQQGIESYRQLEGLTLTFSVDVYASTASVFAFLTDYNGTEDVVSVHHTGGGVWQRLTVVKTIRSGLLSKVNWPHQFGIRCGVAGGGSTTYYMDNATLVVGNFPEGIPFAPLDPATDMARCQRFYETGFARTHTSGTVSTDTNNAMQVTIQIQSKAAVPTVTYVVESTVTETIHKYPGSAGAYSHDGTNWNIYTGAPTVAVTRDTINIYAVRATRIYDYTFSWMFGWIAEVP